jgi:pimeloyl-ACP methyl ester carboxylesterase
MLPTAGADESFLGRGETAAAAGTEAPVVENAHNRDPRGLASRGLMRVVLVHSALGDSRLWKRQVPVLEERFEVVAPDLPGWGQNAMPTEPFSFVDFIAGFLPAALVGNSMGGMIALRTALAHADRVQKLVLVDAGLPAWDWSEEIRDYWAAEAAAFETGDLAAATEENLRFWVKPEHWDEVRPQQHRAFELQSAHEEPEALWPEMPELSSLEVPTLVIVGEDDKGDFGAIAQHLAEEIPDADLAIVPGAGHLVGVDQPEELNALLLEFLGEGAGGGGV